MSNSMLLELMRTFSILSLTALIGCHVPNAQTQPASGLTRTDSLTTAVASPLPTTQVDSSGMTLGTRILPPTGYVRTLADSGSYAAYLRTLPLKPIGSPVMTYDGRVKENWGVYEAVVDLPIGKRDLHQCADAIMRLRAEYLWEQERYDEIHFNFTNGFRVDYTPWMQGQRIGIKGNRTYWYAAKGPSNTYRDFWAYLELIFTYAGTASLEKELRSVPIREMRIGDVFIKGGFPGHAILVADMAVDPETGETLFLLLQSYMPAQEIQLLQNPGDDSLSPWYRQDFGEELRTPEWTFRAEDLKRFEE